ncbi:MAG TPA: TIGR03435 family protein [Acidobacteriaceae bacterium]|nr:TIGR03435 family protein [Acidobacteriaceae bacterium]
MSAEGQAGADVKNDAGAGKVLAFDVVSIKPIEKGGRPTHGWVGHQDHPDGVEFGFQNLWALIQYAYGYKRFPLPDQIMGVPDWAKSQFYDITAKMSAEDIVASQKLDKAGQQQMRQAMTQAMLADRFHLKVHQGTKAAPVFELVVAKGGMKMRDATTDPNPPLGKGEDGKVSPGIRWEKDTSLMQANTMESLAGLLSQPMSGLGRPVVNKTGLTGSYDFTFDWSVYSRSVHTPHPGGTDPEWDPVAAISRAVGEIGLKLQPATGTLDTIAIDQVEKPTDN